MLRESNSPNEFCMNSPQFKKCKLLVRIFAQMDPRNHTGFLKRGEPTPHIQIKNRGLMTLSLVTHPNPGGPSPISKLPFSSGGTLPQQWTQIHNIMNIIEGGPMNLSLVTHPNPGGPSPISKSSFSS